MAKGDYWSSKNLGGSLVGIEMLFAKEMRKGQWMYILSTWKIWSLCVEQVLGKLIHDFFEIQQKRIFESSFIFELLSIWSIQDLER